MLIKEPKIKTNCTKNQLFFDSARSAFLSLLKNTKFEEYEFILMPSYIGQSIKEGSGVFDPVRELQLKYKFYRLNNDLSIDFEDIKKTVQNYKIKMLFIIHYFGFPQKDIEKISVLCKENNIILVEDCTHSFTSTIDNKNIGSFGDYALFSIHKICAAETGGILKINNDKTNILNLCDDDINITINDLYQYVNSDFEAISIKRRENYKYYLEKLNDTSLYEIYYKDLPDGVVPLNFPILIKNADRYDIYKKLIEQNVPCVSLWYKLIDEIDTDVYPVSKMISSTILNLPVHQDITFENINYIIEKLNSLIKKRKILILGGKPIGAVDITKYAKEKGCYTIVCDYLPKKESPAKVIADENWDFSTADIAQITEKAKLEKIDAVFTSIHEFNINKCCEICEKLNLPFYASRKNIDDTSNKKIYKEIFKKFNIPLIPEYKILNTENIPDYIEYPVLIKPIDGTGAYGLQICNSKEDILAKTEETLKYSDKKEFIIEQYIQNKEEITTVYIIKDRIPYLASVADRIVKHFDNSKIPLPVQYIWNSKYLELYKETIDTKMKKAIQFMGLQNGMLFIQSIVKDNIIMPYDIGFRLSGTQEHVILEEICGYNPLKLLTDYALTGILGNDELISKINPDFKISAAQITFLVKPATLSRFEGLDEVEKIPEVIRIIKNKHERETIPQTALGTLNQVALRIFIKGKSREEIINLTKIIRNIVKIYSDKNENIIIEV